jgi:hypothetical protein
MDRKFTDNAYLIPGTTNCYNWSKYSRENIPKPPPNFKVGDKVIFTIETEICKVYEDCDGTPLYELEYVGHGWSEDNIKHFKEE